MAELPRVFHRIRCTTVSPMHLLAGGTGIRDLQELLRYADISKTQVYKYTAQWFDKRGRRGSFNPVNVGQISRE